MAMIAGAAVGGQPYESVFFFFIAGAVVAGFFWPALFPCCALALT
jgi:hypothetical protein